MFLILLAFLQGSTLLLVYWKFCRLNNGFLKDGPSISMRLQIKTLFHHIFKHLKTRQKNTPLGIVFSALFSLFRTVSYFTYYINMKMKQLLETLFYSPDDRQILFKRQDRSSKRTSVIPQRWYLSSFYLLDIYSLNDAAFFPSSRPSPVACYPLKKSS